MCDTDDHRQAHTLGETTRTIISLLLFMHCFCVVTVLSGGFVRSPLEQRMVRVLAPYTQSFNLDPSARRFDLTQGTEEYDDHVIEVSLPQRPDAPLVRLPDVGWSGSPGYQRCQRLASALAFAAHREDDGVGGAYARAIGARVMVEYDVSRVVVRCRPIRAQAMDGLRDETASRAGAGPDSANSPVYEADVWTAEDGTIQVLKRVAPREVAPLFSRTP